jgi:uncharacterized membrane protein
MIKQFLFTLIPLVVLDALWFFTMKPFYHKYLGDLLASSARIWPTIFLYILYSIGIMVLVTLPAISGNYSMLKTVLLGALLGLVVYGVYNLTNQTMLKSWSLTVLFIDIAWGTVLTGLVSFISIWLARLF